MQTARYTNNPYLEDLFAAFDTYSLYGGGEHDIYGGTPPTETKIKESMTAIMRNVFDVFNAGPNTRQVSVESLDNESQDNESYSSTEEYSDNSSILSNEDSVEEVIGDGIDIVDNVAISTGTPSLTKQVLTQEQQAKLDILKIEHGAAFGDLLASAELAQSIKGVDQTILEPFSKIYTYVANTGTGERNPKPPDTIEECTRQIEEFKRLTAMVDMCVKALTQMVQSGEQSMTKLKTELAAIGQGDVNTLADIKDKIASLVTELQTGIDKRTQLESELSVKKADMSRLEQNLSNTVDATTNLTNVISQLNTVIQNNEITILDLEQQLQVSSDKNIRLEQTNQGLISTLNNERVQSAENTQRLRKQLDEVNANLASTTITAEQATSLREQNQKLVEEIAAANQKMDSGRGTNTALQEQLTQLREKNASLVQQVSNMTELQTKYDAIVAKHRDLEAQTAAGTTENAGLKSQLTNANKELDDIKKQMAYMKTHIGIQTDEINRLNDEKKVLQTEYNMLKQANEKMVSQLEDQLHANDDELAQINNELSVKTAEHTAALAAEIDKNKQLTEELAAKTGENATLASATDQQLIAAHASLVQMENELSVLTRAKNEEIARLNVDASSKDTEIAGLRTAVSGKDTEIAGLRTDVSENTAEIANLKTQLAALGTSSSAEKTGLEQQIGVLTGENNDKTARIQELETENLTGSQRNAELASQISGLQSVVAGKDAEINRLQTEHRAAALLQSIDSALDNSRLNAELRKLTEERDQATTQLTNLQAELGNTRAELGNTRAELENTRYNNRRNIAELEKKSQIIIELKTKLTELTNEKQKMDREHAIQSATAENTIANYQMLQTQSTELNQKVQAENDELKKQIEVLTTENTSLKQELETARISAEAANTQYVFNLEQSNKENAMLLDANADLANRNANLVKTVTQLTQQIRETAEQLAAEQKLHNTLKTTHDQLKSTLVTIELEHAKCQESLTKYADIYKIVDINLLVGLANAITSTFIDNFATPENQKSATQHATGLRQLANTTGTGTNRPAQQSSGPVQPVVNQQITVIEKGAATPGMDGLFKNRVEVIA